MRVNDYKEAVTKINSYGTETTDADGKPFRLIIGCATLEQWKSLNIRRTPRPNRTGPRPQTDGK